MKLLSINWTPLNMKSVSFLLLYLICFISGISSITLRGSSQYAVLGKPYTLICSVPNKTASVQYRRTTVTPPFGAIQVGGSDCYNIVVSPAVECNKTVCSCIADGAGKGTEFNWTFTPDNNMDQSIWYCLEFNKNESDRFTLQISVPVKSIALQNDSTSGSDLTINEGTSTSLVCVTSACKPSASVLWYIGATNYTLSSTQTVSKEKGNLFITTSTLTFNPNRTMTGKRLNCSAYNYGDNTVTANNVPKLNVQYSPEGSIVMTRNITAQLTEGMSVGLTCQVSGGHPLASLSWSCKGQTMTSVNRSTGTIAKWELQIVVDKSYDGRSCVCRGTHPLWTETKTITLFVDYPPHGNPGLLVMPQKPYYLVNDSTTLTCKSPSASKPAATITWLCKGQDVTSSATNGNVENVADSSLVIKVDSGYNGQLCVCTVSHKVNNYRQSVNINFNVHYTPTESLVLTADPSEKYKGDNVQIACSIKGGNPLSAVTLSCGARQGIDNSSINTSSRFIDLQNISKDRNNQTCVCTATHINYAAFRPKKELTLVVYYPPETPTIMPVTETFPWLEEQIGRLSCSTVSGNPAATTYQWIGKRISAKEGNRQSVSIGSLSYTDDKTKYKCQVSNKFTVDKGVIVFGTITLNVQYNPRIILNRNQATIRETEIFTQYCNATGNPKPSLQWCHGSPLQCSEKQNPAILSFEKTLRINGDNYTCKAWSNSEKYGKLESSSTFTLTVNYAPDVNVTATNIAVEGVTDLSISCSVKGVPSTYNFHKWQHHYDGVLIRELTDDPVYRFSRPLSFEDSGSYTCIVDNGVTDGNGVLLQNNTYYVMVQYRPHFTTKPMTQVSIDNQAFLSVSVEFITFPIKNYSMWSKDDGNFSESTTTTTTTYLHPVVTTFYGKLVTINNFGYQSWLNFSSFSTSDKGKYSLTVANIIGSDNYSFKASFKGPPDIPTTLELLSVTERSVNVSWIAGENNGFNQTFHLSYESTGSQFIQNITETEKKKYGVVITSLQSQTLYILKLTVSNERGYNPGALIRNFTTLKEVVKSEPTFQAAIIGAGAAAGVVLAILVVVAIIFVIKRRRTVSKGDDTELMSRRNGNPEVDVPDDGMKPNIIYESAGPVNDTQSGKTGEKYVYAEVNKPCGAVAKPNDVCVEVNKKEPPGVLYAEVQKPGKKKGGKKEKNSGVKKETTGDVYENVAVIGDSTGDVYANSPEKQNKTPPKEKLSRRKNKDGLVYIDVVIKNIAGNGGKKGVIHGIENRNDYAEVDFTRHADPLPSDDDEYDMTSDKTPERNYQE